VSSLTMATSPRPPLLGLVLAVGLHLTLFISVQITSTKNSTTGVALTKAAVMAVRSIEAATATATGTATATATATARVSPEAPGLSDSPPAAVLQGFSATPADLSTGVVSTPISELKPTPARENATPASGPISPATLAIPLASSMQPASELPAAPQYRAAGSLDPGPKPLSDINPDYPARAGQQQGLVVLRLLINEQGVVDNVAVVRATPAGYFEESALDAFGKALFSPGKLLGVAVKSQITVEVEFMPINRGATVSGRTY
jgi:periplasmic protein TonB